MSEPTPTARPRQVTLVGWLTVVGSVVVLLLVFDRMAGMHTLDAQASAERFLAEPPGRDLGLGVDGVLSIMRTAALVAGGCAAAAAILGFHVLKRSRSARLGLSILAVPLFLAGMVTGGFVSSLVAASSVMLWLQPARDWFDGKATPRPDEQPARRVAPTPVSSPTQAPDQVPGQAPVQAPFPGYAGAGGRHAAPAVPATRPAAVTWACLLTWVGSGLTFAGALASGVLLGMDPGLLVDEVYRQNPDLESQGVSDDLLVGVSLAMLAGFALWCLAAAAVAVFVMRGREWARITLIISAATAAAVFLLCTVLGAFVLALTLAAAGATVALLIRPESRAWFSSRRGQRPPAGAIPPR